MVKEAAPPVKTKMHLCLTRFVLGVDALVHASICWNIDLEGVVLLPDDALMLMDGSLHDDTWRPAFGDLG